MIGSKWFPWRFIVRRFAGAHGFIDPIVLLSHLHRFGQPSEVAEPIELLRAERLPEPGGLGRSEPRGALWVAVEIEGIEVQTINTHLDLLPVGLLPCERRVQTEALLGADWVGGMTCASPKILCGDFNALPSSPVYRRLAARLNDVQTMLEQQRPRNTFFGRYPTARIDHVFVGTGFEVLAAEVPSDHRARVASDHLPLVVDLCI